MSGQFNFTNANQRRALEQGSQFKHRLTMQESETGPPIDITGWTWEMQIRKRVDDPAILTLTSDGNGIDLIDETNGIIEINVSSADTEALEPGTYKYDLEYTNGTETVRLLEGDVEITAQITK
jgi:hypothetical protein